MKSKRVTKLLACVLAASMCAVPVFAAEPTTIINTDNADGSFAVDFAKKGINVQVSVPTNAHLRVNPLTTLTGMQGTVSNSQIATDDLRIINKTWAPVAGTTSDNEGIPVIVTAYATATKAEGVKLFYTNTETDTFSADSDDKNAMMKLVSGNLPNPSGNATYSTTGGSYVTELGSRIKFSVPGAGSVSSGTSNITISDNGAGLGAMAITGQATVNAPWQNDDIAVEFVYNIRASKAPVNDAQPTAAYATNKITIVAANLNKATVTGVAIQDPVANSYGFFPVELEENAITTKADGSIEIAVPTGLTDFLKSDDSGCKGKDQDLFIQLSDGRVIVSEMSVN